MESGDRWLLDSLLGRDTHAHLMGGWTMVAELINTASTVTVIMTNAICNKDLYIYIRRLLPLLIPLVLRLLAHSCKSLVCVILYFYCTDPYKFKTPMVIYISFYVFQLS